MITKTESEYLLAEAKAAPGDCLPHSFSQFSVGSKSAKIPSVAVICDMPEENWPSMDLVGEMLLKHLQTEYADSFSATGISHSMRRRFSSIQPGNSYLFNADRVLNRFWHYPRVLKQMSREFDLFHVVDHSYAQLLHSLPPQRTIVTCHDLDTFQCILEPAKEPRSVLFKAIVKRTLTGLQQAALVTCDSKATRDQLLFYGIVPAERLIVVPNGVHPSCSTSPDLLADAEAERLLQQPQGEVIEILHVGSTIARKRIDVLLHVFASVLAEFPTAQLVRVGGNFTPEQNQLVRQLNLEKAIKVLPYLERNVLAAVYRRSTLVLQPSEREGFGLPLVEAMACGVPVVASDLEVLREVGGEAATYCPVADVSAWSTNIISLLHERSRNAERWAARRAAGLNHAAKFSWAEYAREMTTLYRQLL